jgi:hypothetical protein
METMSGGCSRIQVEAYLSPCSLILTHPIGQIKGSLLYSLLRSKLPMLSLHHNLTSVARIVWNFMAQIKDQLFAYIEHNNDFLIIHSACNIEDRQSVWISFLLYIVSRLYLVYRYFISFAHFVLQLM